MCYKRDQQSTSFSPFSILTTSITTNPFVVVIALVAASRFIQRFFYFFHPRFPIFFIRMSTYDDTKAAAAHKSEETKGAAQDFTGAAQQKAGEAGGFSQDKGIQAKEGVSGMVKQAGDAIGNAAQSVADTVNPNKSD